jgi:Fe2+ or Zn2+ uptake regulation protein
MKKRKLIEQDVETITTHQIECGSCGNVFQSESDTVEEFISEIENDIHYAISKEYGLQGLICDDCFNDEDSDWKEYEKAI